MKPWNIKQFDQRLQQYAGSSVRLLSVLKSNQCSINKINKIDDHPIKTNVIRLISFLGRV